MSSNLVFKVAYGDTIRRFNLRICENKKLELNMSQFKERIRRLFSLNVDADDFVLRYKDIDGDVVSLVEDYDLDDIVFQGLNPVKIVLSLKTSGKSRSGSVSVECESRSRKIESIQFGLEEVVRGVDEPLHGKIMKLIKDLVAEVSGPIVPDVVCSMSEDFKSVSEKELNVGVKASEGSKISSGSKSNENAESSLGMLGDKVRKDNVKEVECEVSGLPDLNYPPPFPSDFLTTMDACNARCDNSGKGKTCFQAFDVNPFNECPFSGTQVDVNFYPSRKGNHIPLIKKSPGEFETVPVFHTGVQCDVCGIQPITGPRFMSFVRYNYDLCSECYQMSESKATYVRVDIPLRFPNVLDEFHHEFVGHGHMFPVVEPDKPIVHRRDPVSGRPVPLGNQRKLSSRFVSDVTVVDGTIMTPSVRFTKIWRMKNDGKVVWPTGTQIVWVDGKKLSNALSVDLEIPADGLPVNRELDVSVDFVAPELPGKYISYWRMSLPSGQKFGQKIWVVIQVDESHDPLSDVFKKLNLDLPPASNRLNDPVVFDLNIEPSVVDSCRPLNSALAVLSKPMDKQCKTVAETVTEMFAEVLDEDLKPLPMESTSEKRESGSRERNLNFPANDSLLLGDELVKSPALPADSSVYDSHVDSTTIKVGSSPMNASSNVKRQIHSTQSENFSQATEPEDLSEMHINQADVNDEILKTMDSHLDQAQDFLCGRFGWDHILDELEMMGFVDKMKNIELVLKNKGSIKRAVMDLVASEKSQ